MSDGDLGLLDAWAAGDAAAGRALFDRHFDAIYRFFANKVRSDAVADLVQHTFLECIEARQRFRRDATFRTFLFQIARHQLYAHVRITKRCSAVDIAEVPIASPDTSPTGRLARRDDREALVSAMEALPLELRMVLEFTFWHELSTQDVALVLGIAENTVYTRIHRAKTQLRRALTDISRPRLDDDTLDVRLRAARA
jgi:RNA polymerase sigma-70 factor (ECF subfamily)